jgi:hypothetical protein
MFFWKLEFERLILARTPEMVKAAVLRETCGLLAFFSSMMSFGQL